MRKKSQDTIIMKHRYSPEAAQKKNNTNTKTILNINYYQLKELLKKNTT